MCGGDGDGDLGGRDLHCLVGWLKDVFGAAAAEWGRVSCCHGVGRVGGDLVLLQWGVWLHVLCLLRATNGVNAVAVGCGRTRFAIRLRGGGGALQLLTYGRSCWGRSMLLKCCASHHVVATV